MYGYWKYKCHVLIFYGSELTIYNSGVILNNRWLSGGGGGGGGGVGGEKFIRDCG